MVRKKNNVIVLLLAVSGLFAANASSNPFKPGHAISKHKSLKQNTSAVNEIKRAIIDSKDCARLVQHQPKGDVIYKPGIDAYGKSVVGPELGREHKIKPPTTIQFSLGFNPLKGAAASRFEETSVGVGRIKYDISKNGFTFNGLPMNEKAVADLARKCRAAGL